MKKHFRILSLFLAILLTLCLCACAPTQAPNTDSEAPASSQTQGNSDVKNTITITVDVVGSDGKTTTFTIETAEEYLRGALEQENLVEGEDGPYGLYISHVNGERAVYETDGAYWAVYEGDVAAMTGVDEIQLKDGATYKLVYTKA